MNERITHHRYVTFDRVKMYLACGWCFGAFLGPSHGQYSIMMDWLCDCPICEPTREAKP
jgi:hypothetical protein